MQIVTITALFGTSSSLQIHATGAHFHGGVQLHALPSLALRTDPLCMLADAPEGEEEKTAAPETIFTLQDRDDGWDDVRGSIKAAIKDREKPYQDIKENYVKPAAATVATAARWAKVLAEELPGVGTGIAVAGDSVKAVGQAAGTGIKAAGSGLAARGKGSVSLQKSVTKSTIGLVGSVADAAAARRKAAKAKVMSKAKPKAAVSPAAGANLALLTGVPFITLVLVALLGTGQL